MLFVDHMKVVANAEYVKTRAALNICLGGMAVALQLENLGTEVLRLAKTGGRHLWDGVNDHIKLNTTTSSIRRQRTRATLCCWLVSSVPVSGSVLAPIWVCT